MLPFSTSLSDVTTWTLPFSSHPLLILLSFFLFIFWSCFVLFWVWKGAECQGLSKGITSGGGGRGGPHGGTPSSGTRGRSLPKAPGTSQALSVMLGACLSRWQDGHNRRWRSSCCEVQGAAARPGPPSPTGPFLALTPTSGAETLCSQQKMRQSLCPGFQNCSGHFCSDTLE